MTTRIAWVSMVGLVVAMGACSSATDEDEASQAIQAMEQDDAEAVRACEDEAASCASDGVGDNGDAACQGMAASCQEMEGQLAQIRERAVACWESAHECSGANCKGTAKQCRALSETVGEARQPVLECGQNVRQCMRQAVSSSAEGAMELCGAVRQACGEGVAAASVSRVRTAAQEQIQSGDGEQPADGSGEGAELGGQQEGSSGGNGSTEVQEGDEGASEDQTGAENESGEGETSRTRERQQACLDEVKACCDAAGSPEADPDRLRQGDSACALSACSGE